MRETSRIEQGCSNEFDDRGRPMVLAIAEDSAQVMDYFDEDGRYLRTVRPPAELAALQARRSWRHDARRLLVELCHRCSVLLGALAGSSLVQQLRCPYVFALTPSTVSGG